VTVARQAIYDANLQVIGYELLYRHSADNTAVIDDAAVATAQVIIAAVIDIGLNTLVGSHPGFINCPRDILTRPESMPGPTERVVIEVLEDVVADDEVRAGIKCLRDRGHLIALDDFEYGALSHALLDMADIVKIDLQAVDDQELKMYARDLRGSGRRMPVNRLGLLQLLVQLCDPEFSVTELASRVSADAGLSVGVLRCINSSFHGLARRLESIEQAIVLLGLDTLRSLCTLVAVAGFADRPASLMAQAVIRARMCELLAVAAGHRDRGATSSPDCCR